ncbi:MAG: phosphotransferase [Gammaproteobacteria bacterium]
MNSNSRLTQLHEWIKENLGNIEYSLTPISGDASFRRYFRLTNNNYNYIAVDSPPDKENNDKFVNITHLLEAEGLPVPHIHYSSLDFGFFLLRDLGDELLLDVLDDNSVDDLYEKALNALIIIQQTPATSLPLYDEQLLLQEMELFREWFLTKHLSLQLTDDNNSLLNDTFKILANNALQQPQVFVHRDFHSRNLMQIEGKYPGIIDYQDAVLGPITYDLVSLLRDCYIQWPNVKVNKIVQNFYKQMIDEGSVANVEEKVFIKWFDLMGIQRHLKAVGIFSRLNIRDKKPAYLRDIPRTLGYIELIAKNYPETFKLSEFITREVSL